MYPASADAVKSLLTLRRTHHALEFFLCFILSFRSLNSLSLTLCIVSFPSLAGFLSAHPLSLSLCGTQPLNFPLHFAIFFKRRKIKERRFSAAICFEAATWSLSSASLHTV